MMKKKAFLYLTLCLLSLTSLAQANQHFNKAESLSIIQNEIDKKDQLNLLTVHVQLELIGKELQKTWDAQLFGSTLKFYPPLFKKMDHYATVEAIAPFYEKHKSQIDEMVKKNLEPSDQEEFHRRLKLALKVQLEGNG